MSSIEISSNARSPNSRRPVSSRCSRVVTRASLLNLIQEGTVPLIALRNERDWPSEAHDGGLQERALDGRADDVVMRGRRRAVGRAFLAGHAEPAALRALAPRRAG